MNTDQQIELGLDCASLAIFILYHVWHFCLPCYHARGHVKIGKRRYFNSDQFCRDGTAVWVHAFGQQQDEIQTAVHTLRNTIMATTLLATASAYIGARALPTVFFDDRYSENLFRLSRIDPITGGDNGRDALIKPQIKAAISFCTILAGFLCFAQATRLLSISTFPSTNLMALGLYWIFLSALDSRAAIMPIAGAWAVHAGVIAVLLGRYYVHTGFLLRVMVRNTTEPKINFEGELLSIMDIGQITFSMGLRLIVAFGLVISYFAGPTTLFVATVVVTFLIFLGDHQRVIPYRMVNEDLDSLARQQSVPAFAHKHDKFSEIHKQHQNGISNRHQD